jgi:hypothetical protein
VRCPACEQPIRGRSHVPGVVSAQAYKPPNFCHSCGSPFPWAGRQARIHQLQNLLDEAELGSATGLALTEQLQALLDPDLDDAEQAKRWNRIKTKGPGFLEKTAAQLIVQSLLSAWLKAGYGRIPPPAFDGFGDER